MTSKDSPGILDRLDQASLDELSAALMDDSRRGINEAAGRVAQVRADVFAKVRDLQLELDNRVAPSTASIELGHGQIAIGLIVELGTTIKAAFDRRGPVEQTIRALQVAYDNFERKARKLLEAAIILEDRSTVEATATEVE